MFVRTRSKREPRRRGKAKSAWVGAIAKRRRNATNKHSLDVEAVRMKLYYDPLSPYSEETLIAFYEKGGV